MSISATRKFKLVGTANPAKQGLGFGLTPIDFAGLEFDRAGFVRLHGQS